MNAPAGEGAAAPVRVYVAAGSNVDPGHNLALAARELRRAFAAVDFSPAYRNVAVGFEGEDFVNWVAGFDTCLGVHEVIAELQRIEGLCGRTRDAPKWAPRSMDLDILLYGDLRCEQPGLVLPRPDLVKRPYMLGPMADLAPGLRHPTLGATFGELWQRFDRAAHPMTVVPFDPGAPAT
ncbi:MAG: 2-amino-4-hydroxy-6-hydroxymethyldihydropteridine diphosphokinase [Steroidobacteraceae bacterium]|jgi:2-amino-4-hydroxy-6-hydroxymethyldihydropteridine diphosphokinase|nr:2-amino-4-hydroxy-6-hydroxymethyldihydropteridine diphosphokinase [Steroidobacteraceae bacterium]